MDNGEKGSRQVSIKSLDDKHEITVLLAVNMSGEALPGQVIYQGTTDRCHPRYEFPGSWQVPLTSSHWSTKDTILEYIDKVLDHFLPEKTGIRIVGEAPWLVDR